jgi:hypothetical protein
VTDGHEGLLAAVQELFPATPRQRCLVHKQRNVLSAVPRRVRKPGRDRTSWHLGTAHQGGSLDPACREHSPNMANSIQRPSGA